MIIFENEFCRYFREGNCELDNLELDALGNCRSCMLLDVPEEILKIAREKIKEDDM